jgi:aryl-alcohol dehydrogenase-like predicted oxidoreductase
VDLGSLVSDPLIFGGAPIGGLYAPVSDEAAAGTLAAAWAAGIRAFETTPHYRPAGLTGRALRHPAVTASPPYSPTGRG